MFVAIAEGFRNNIWIYINELTYNAGIEWMREFSKWVQYE